MKMFNKMILLLLAELLLSACQGMDYPLTPSTTPSNFVEFSKTGPVGSPPAEIPQVVITPTPARPTPVQRSSSTPWPTHASPIILAQPGPLYETVFSLPVDGDIIRYRGRENPDMETTGPDALAILADNTFLIGDLTGNRLLHFDLQGKLLDYIDLNNLGIINVSDLRVKDQAIYLLEVTFKTSPPRYRVNHLSLEESLLGWEDIPFGYRIEDGLTGIGIDCDDNILLEIEGATKLYHLSDAQRQPDPAMVANGYSCNRKLFQINSVLFGPPILDAGQDRYMTELTTGFGGFRLIDVYPDGSFYVMRDDVVNDQRIKVDETIHFIDSEGEIMGVARVPLADFYYPINRCAAIAPQGEVFVIVPRYESLDIVRLNFYESLPPLIQGAAPPIITRQ